MNINRTKWCKMCEILTSDGGSEHDSGRLAGLAQRRAELQRVLREGERRDGVSRGDDHEQRDPQVEERWQWTERLPNVGVVAPGLGDHRSCQTKMHTIIGACGS